MDLDGRCRGADRALDSGPSHHATTPVGRSLKDMRTIKAALRAGDRQPDGPLHETFIHAETIGSDEVAATPIATEVTGDVVRCLRHMRRVPVPPFYRQSTGLRGRSRRKQHASRTKYKAETWWWQCIVATIGAMWLCGLGSVICWYCVDACLLLYVVVLVMVVGLSWLIGSFCGCWIGCLVLMVFTFTGGGGCCGGGWLSSLLVVVLFGGVFVWWCMMVWAVVCADGWLGVQRL